MSIILYIIIINLHYYYSFHQFRYVTHCLLHISKSLEGKHCQLDVTAAWPFESFSRIFHPFMRSGHMALNQLNNRLTERYVHHVSTFMDLINPSSNRMRYVIGDITASSTMTDDTNHNQQQQQQQQQSTHNSDVDRTSNVITTPSSSAATTTDAGVADATNNPPPSAPPAAQRRKKGQKRKQQRLISITKTAKTYSHHMRVHTLAQSKSGFTSPDAAMNIPLRMFIGHKRKMFPQQQSAAPLIPKRLVFEQFEVGNEFPDNCILVLNLRPWIRERKITYSVMFVTDITAVYTTPDHVDKLAHLWNAISAKEMTAGDRDGAATDSSHVEQMTNDDSGTNPMKKSPPKVVFHLTVTRFQEQEPFDTYPVKSSLNHIYLVGRPRETQETILAHQVMAKMNPRPLMLSKPYNYTSQTKSGPPTSSTQINQQKWFVSPILHSLASTETSSNESSAPTLY